MNQSSFTQTLGVSAGNLLDKVKAIDRVDIERLGKVTSIALVSYFVTSKIYGAFFSPLSQIPGPFQLRFYDMRYAPNFESPPGTSWRVMMKWRKEYGDIVRVGPNRVMVSSKHAVRQIAAEDCSKGPAYERLQKSRGGVALTSAVDKVFHKQRRRVLAPAFSGKNVSLLEQPALSSIESLIQIIDCTIKKTQDKNGYALIDIWDLLEKLGIDILGYMAFSTEFKALESNKHPMQRTARKEEKALEFAVAHPILIDFIMAMPFRKLLLARSNEAMELLKDIIEKRLAGDKKAHRMDFLQTMIDTQRPECLHKEIPVDDMILESMSLLIAGANITSQNNAFAFIHLLKYPQALAPLRKEIDGVKLESNKSLLSDMQLQKLPYLNAFIHESLRLNGLSAIGAERIADKDMLLDENVFIPKGTILHGNLFHVLTDPTCWPEPEKFIPERWLKESSIPADQEAFVAFSLGVRNCIGQKIALQEMRLSIGNLVKLFDFKAIPEEMAAAEDLRGVRTLKLHSNSFKVLMKHRENQ